MTPRIDLPNNESTVTQAAAATSPWAKVPKMMWGGLAALALTTAALGGALVNQATAQRAAPAGGAASSLQAQPPVFDGPEAAKAQTAPKSPTNGLVATAGQQAAKAPVQPCATCGTVESVRAVKVKGQSTGVGVVGGALAGGLVGHQFGGGTGKTALTIAGAAGGALAGREVERNMRASTAYDVRVRMHDGSVRSFRRASPVAVGAQVSVEGRQLKLVQASR